MTTDPPHDQPAPSSAELFWGTHYQKGPRPWTGRPNALLAQWTHVRAPGYALDLGCGEGNSAVWLAQQGWQVRGVDVSSTALQRAAIHAEHAGVSNRTVFEHHDLGLSFPSGHYDLVYALYLQSPLALPRARVMQAAAGAVALGGLLLIVDHASVAPWSWPHDGSFPTPQEALSTLNLNLNDWNLLFMGEPSRELTGPGGQNATVKDTVLALQKKA